MLWTAFVLVLVGLLVWTFRARTAESGDRAEELGAIRAAAPESAASPVPPLELERTSTQEAAQVAPASLDVEVLHAKLKSGELRWMELDDEQRLAVGLRIGRETYGTLSQDRQRALVRDLVNPSLESERRGARSNLDDLDRRHLEHLKEQYMLEALPLAERAVAAAAEDMLSAWDRGENLTTWRSGETPASAASDCDLLGHVRQQCNGWLAPGFEFRFTYSSAQNAAVQSGLDRVRELRLELHNRWREYVSTR